MLVQQLPLLLGLGTQTHVYMLNLVNTVDGATATSIYSSMQHSTAHACMHALGMRMTLHWQWYICYNATGCVIVCRTTATTSSSVKFMMENHLRDVSDGPSLGWTVLDACDSNIDTTNMSYYTILLLYRCRV